MAITHDQIEKWFGDKSKLRTPDDARTIEIQAAAKRLAMTIVSQTPASSDQSIAVRKVREAQIAAFQAIAFND